MVYWSPEWLPPYITLTYVFMTGCLIDQLIDLINHIETTLFIEVSAYQLILTSINHSLCLCIDLDHIIIILHIWELSQHISISPTLSPLWWTFILFQLLLIDWVDSHQWSYLLLLILHILCFLLWRYSQQPPIQQWII